MDLFEDVMTQGYVYIVHLYAICLAFLIAAHLSRRQIFKNLASGFIAGTLLLQGCLIVLLIMQGKFSRVGYVSCLTFAMSLLGLLFWRLKHFIFLALVAIPLSLVVCMLSIPSMRKEVGIPDDFSTMFTVIHVGAIFAALVTMAIGFCAGCVFLLSERQLKLKTRMTERHRELPSLHALDRINHLMTCIGFPLFTIGVIGGLVGSRMAWGNVFSGDVKELVTIMVWSIFAKLFHERLVAGRRGHSSAIYMVIVFLLSILSLTVVNLFMTTTHQL